MPLLAPHFRTLYPNADISEVVDQVNAIQEFIMQLPLRAGSDNIRILQGTDGQIIEVDTASVTIEEGPITVQGGPTGTRLQ